MKKMITLMLALCLVLTMAACGKSAASDKTFKEHGLELISMMEEMAANEGYVEMYTGNTDMKEIVSKVVDGHYSKPKTVYCITFPEETLAAMAELESMGTMRAPLKDYVLARTHAALVTQINAYGGAEVLAASTIITAGKTFVFDGFDGNVIYLYTFEEGLPAFVSFTSGEDNTVSATANFVLYDGFKADSATDVEAFFSEAVPIVEVLGE